MRPKPRRANSPTKPPRPEAIGQEDGAGRMETASAKSGSAQGANKILSQKRRKPRASKSRAAQSNRKTGSRAAARPKPWSNASARRAPARPMML